MYAVIKTGGKQYKVSPGDVLKVEKLDAAPGDEVALSQVLMVVNGDDVTIGNPLVQGASVKARVLEQGRAKKVIVFKKKRRKGYKVKNGHRQPFTAIEIQEVSA